MNQTFNSQRFLLIIRLEIAEKGRTQLLMAAVLVGTLLLMMLPIMFNNEHNNTLRALHIIALIMLVLFGGSLYTNQVFGQFDSTNSTIAALMVPASRLEKFLSTLLLNLMFMIPFILLFVGLHYWTTEYANIHLITNEEKYELLPKSILYFMILMALVIQGAAFLGAIYFTKATYIKTAAAFFVLIVFGVTANHYLAKNMVPSPTYFSALPFAGWTMVFNKSGQFSNYTVDLPESIHYFVYALPIVVMLAFWYIAYVRMVEKEV